MKFSILIAHYNNAHYFKQCYESLKNQTFQDFEIILVDDCSTDNSLQEIRVYTKEDRRIKIFENPVNKGVGFTKKKCVELAEGEICGFVDPDDALLPNAIEDSLKAFENQNIIATYSQFYLCDEHLTPQKKFPNTKKIKNDNLLFFNINFEIAHFFTFRKAAYLKTEGINENYRVAEDIDFYLKLYEIGNFEYINTPLYLYRLHSSGLSHEKSKNDLKKSNWHIVLLNAAKRRGLKSLYGQNISMIDNLPIFLYKKQNTFFQKLLKKIS